MLGIKSMSKKIKTTVIILIALIILGASALAGRLVYLNFIKDNTTTVIVPNNEIVNSPSVTDKTSEAEDSSAVSDSQAVTDSKDSEAVSTPVTDAASESVTERPTPDTSSADTSVSEIKAATVEIYKGKEYDNESFSVDGMLPGDVETMYYAVKVNHHTTAAIFFSAKVTEQEKALGDKLNIKITHVDSASVLYDGPFAGLDAEGYGVSLAATDTKETVAVYRIDVSLPTDAGNEYQGARLKADFEWFAKDTGPLSPPTGDRSTVIISTVMCACVLTVFALLIFARKKDDAEEKDEAK